MMVLIVLTAFLLFVLLYLLWVPVVLEVNTDRQWYGLHIGRGIDLRLRIEDMVNPRFQVRFGWWKRDWPLIRMRKKKKKDKPADKSESSALQPRTKRGLSLTTWWRLLNTFRVKRLFLLIDTDDFALNAWLFPLSTYLQSRGWPVYINFMGRQRLHLEIENRAYRIIGAFIRF